MPKHNKSKKSLPAEHAESAEQNEPDVVPEAENVSDEQIEELLRQANEQSGPIDAEAVAEDMEGEEDAEEDKDHSAGLSGEQEDAADAPEAAEEDMDQEMEGAEGEAEEGAVEDAIEDEEEEEQQEDENAVHGEEKFRAASSDVLTKQDLERMMESLTSSAPSGNAIKKITRFFGYAVHLGDAEKKEQKQKNEGENKEKLKLKKKADLAGATSVTVLATHFESVEVFETLLKFCFGKMHSVWNNLFFGPHSAAAAADEDAEMKDAEAEEKKEDEEEPKKEKETQLHEYRKLASKLVRCKNWMKQGPSLQAYLTHLLHFLSAVVNQNATILALQHTEQLLPYFIPFPKLSKRICQLLIEIWTQADEDARILAFLQLRTIAVAFPPAFLTMLLKACYMQYVKNSKLITMKTAPMIRFLGECVQEMFLLDPRQSYSHAFLFIRQLALHLRNALSTKTKEAYKSVYNWQFINCLRVWSLIISTACAPLPNTTTPNTSHELYPLLYPLIQIITSTIELIPSARYFPLRFMCVRMLNEISSRTGVFIPASSHLLHVFESSLVNNKPLLDKGKAPRINMCIKVSNQAAQSRSYQALVVSESLFLLQEHLSIYSYSVGFPELVVPVTSFLRHFALGCTVIAYRKQVMNCVDALERNAAWVSEQRQQLTIAPRDVKQLDTLRVSKAGKPQISPLDLALKTQKKVHDASQAKEMTKAEWEKLMAEEKKASGKGQKRARDEEGSEQEEEEEEEEGAAATPSKKSHKKGAQPPKKKQRVEQAEPEPEAAAAAAGSEDEVEDFDFSSFD